LHSIFVFTHDSIAVGEDGPTHEPVEQTMSLRMIPELTVFRPADANETAEVWKLAIERKTASVLVFSRQDLAILDPNAVRGNVAKGAYILSDTEGEPDVTLLATGSEVELSLLAKDLLAEHGVQARVVSMPSWELFDAQSAEYREQVLGPKGAARVSVEAGVTIGWAKYTGGNGAHVGIDSYGASGPGSEVLKHFGFTKEHVAATVMRLLGKTDVADDLDKEFSAGQPAGKQPAGNDGHS
jgi:transketolase